MKNVKLLDALPSVFGVFSLVGYVLVYLFNPGANPGPVGTLGPMLLFGAGAVALVAGLLSLFNTGRNKTPKAVRIVNLVWVLLVGVYFAWIVHIGLSFHIPD